jgi:hypothetical protein
MKKEDKEKQFNDLVEKARQEYPDIDDSIALYSNIIEYNSYLEDYLDILTQIQTPNEILTNEIILT